MMRERSDCTFLFITKRIDRFLECAPPDWDDGYDYYRRGIDSVSQAEQPPYRNIPRCTREVNMAEPVGQ